MQLSQNVGGVTLHTPIRFVFVLVHHNGFENPRKKVAFESHAIDYRSCISNAPDPTTHNQHRPRAERWYDGSDHVRAG